MPKLVQSRRRWLGGSGPKGTRWPSWLAAVDAWAGATDAIGWAATSEVPCPNCTDFEDLLIVWYPSVGKVAVLRGGHGWDS